MSDGRSWLPGEYLNNATRPTRTAQHQGRSGQWRNGKRSISIAAKIRDFTKSLANKRNRELLTKDNLVRVIAKEYKETTKGYYVGRMRRNALEIIGAERKHAQY